MSLGALMVGTPYTLDDGTVVYLDDEGRVMVPPPPSAWDIFWRNPSSEVRSATGEVVTTVGELLGGVGGAAVGGFGAGVGKGVASGLSSGLSEGFGGGGGAIALIGLVTLVGVLVLRR